MTTHTQDLLARIGVLAITALAALAFSSIPDQAGAASSGGIATESANSSESDDEGDKYARIWQRTGSSDRAWARRTAECESGRDPDAIGNGGMFRGAFQFMKSTWKSAPKSPGGDPIAYPYRTQAVVAIALKNKDGAGHWPNCG